MKRALCVFALLITVFFATAAADDDPLRLVPPDATLLVGFHWKEFLGSPAGQALQTQFQRGFAAPGIPLPAGALDWFQALAGQIDEAMLAMPSSAADDKNGGVPLVILRGQFDVKELRARTLAKVKPEMYRSVELYRSRGAESPFYRVAFPDVNTVLMGDRKFVRGAIDRWYQASADEPSNVVERARSIMNAGHIWVSATLGEDFLKDAKDPAVAALLAELETIDGVMSFQDGFVVAIHLGARSGESAEKIKMLVQAGVGMALQNQPPEVAEVLKRLQVTRNDSVVRISLGMTQGEVVRLATARLATPPDDKTTLASAKPARSRRAAAAPQRDYKVRIYGLEEGVREISLRPAQQP